MNDVPRHALRQLIAKYGPDLCSDVRRCEGLLRDLCGAHRREINILTGALDERVPLDLLAAQSTIPRELLLTRLAKRLEDQLALTEEAARWAVDSWALALGLVTEREVEEREKKRLGDGSPSGPAAATARLGDEDDGGLKELTADTRTPPAQKGQQTPPPRSQPRTIPRPPNAPAIIPPAATPPPTGGSLVIHPRTSAGATQAAQPSPAPSATQPLDPYPDPAASKRRGKWRGCLIGCFLLVLLSALLSLVAPYVVSVLREEQRQINNEPPRLPSQ